jgi:hypothetical protein
MDKNQQGRQFHISYWIRISDVCCQIWVPEHDNSDLPQMNNMNWTAEQSGQNQEDRDRSIAEHWCVQTPYVLFSRHHWMPGMPLGNGPTVERDGCVYPDPTVLVRSRSALGG